MKRVIGVGGVFFKARDPKALKAWYARHLGVPVDDHGYVTFQAERGDMTVWEPFAPDTTHFGPGPQSWMLNYRVENLEELLSALAAEGVEIDPKREDTPYGRFAWIVDPEGNRVELWEPQA
jgi:predicted enzyme related to lactoylglutathione lyase